MRGPETPAQAPPGIGRPSRAFVRWAAILVIVILIAGLSVALWYSSYVGPTYEVETLATGEIALSLPIMTYYSLPSFGPRGTSEVGVTLMNTTFLDFAWGNVSGVSRPVRFTIRPNASGAAAFEAGVTNGFRLGPVPPGMSSMSFGIAVGNGAGVATIDCVLNYTVKTMARQVGFGSESWLEVNYALSSNGGTLANLPYANITSPSPADLAYAGNETVSLAAPWQFQRSLANFTKSATPFRNTVGPIVLSLGSAGNLTAELTSAFTWGPNDNYAISLSGRRDTTLNLTWYWDLRFGSLIAM